MPVVSCLRNKDLLFFSSKSFLGLSCHPQVSPNGKEGFVQPIQNSQLQCNPAAPPSKPPFSPWPASICPPNHSSPSSLSKDTLNLLTIRLALPWSSHNLISLWHGALNCPFFEIFSLLAEADTAGYLPNTHFPILSYKKNSILFRVKMYPPKTAFFGLLALQGWPCDTVFFSDL